MYFIFKFVRKSIFSTFVRLSIHLALIFALILNFYELVVDVNATVVVIVCYRILYNIKKIFHKAVKKEMQNKLRIKFNHIDLMTDFIQK